MSQKSQLIREIHFVEEEIKFLEIKRSRSQASLIESLIGGGSVEDTDAQFFRTYTAEIEVKREQLQKMVKQLDSLN